MAKFEDNLSPYLTVVEQASTPANPSSGDQKLFVRTSDHVLCYVNSSGTVTPVFAVEFATASDAVATRESTASGSFVDLTTAGPAVTVTIGASGKAKVSVTAQIEATSTANGGAMGFVASGANTIAADYNRSLLSQPQGNYVQATATFWLSGLAAGSTTFTAKYAAQSGTAYFRARVIAVEPVL